LNLKSPQNRRKKTSRCFSREHNIIPEVIFFIEYLAVSFEKCNFAAENFIEKCIF